MKAKVPSRKIRRRREDDTELFEAIVYYTKTHFQLLKSSLQRDFMIPDEILDRWPIYVDWTAMDLMTSYVRAGNFRPEDAAIFTCGWSLATNENPLAHLKNSPDLRVFLYAIPMLEKAYAHLRKHVKLYESELNAMSASINANAKGPFCIRLLSTYMKHNLVCFREYVKAVLEDIDRELKIYSIE